MPVVVKNESRENAPHLAWNAIKNKILSPRYALDVVFVNPAKMKTLNKTYRHKSKTTNVLSFGLSKNEGEIFMDLKAARQEAPERAMDERTYVLFLYIHALLHLKGFDHETARDGARMERQETKWLKVLR